MKLGNRVIANLSVAFICILFAQTATAIPEGFSLKPYVVELPDARSLALGDNGEIYVGTRIAGKLYAVVDADKDGQADKVYTLAEGLSLPNGVAFHNGDLYVAEVSRILRFKGIGSRLDHPPKAEIIHDRLPVNAHHGWRYLRVGSDDRLYLSIGAPCNVCEHDNPLFGTLIRLELDGSNLEILAKGVRNSLGFDWHPESRKLWFTDNGRDHLSDNQPADELNVLAEKGQHFGFPWCHGKELADPKMGTPLKPCERFEPPAWEFMAHSAALGIHFYTGEMFPEQYRGRLFVALHGSWNRSRPSGYKIVTLEYKDGLPNKEIVFHEEATTFQGKKPIRPVDFLQLRDGSLLFSDDKRGALYRISWH